MREKGTAKERERERREKRRNQFDIQSNKTGFFRCTGMMIAASECLHFDIDQSNIHPPVQVIRLND
jgi:hypothetical protein